jgi:circadian clock protein KaiC
MHHDTSIRNPDPPLRISSGCEGLDEILEGGLTPRRLYLFEGVPGSGKTTLALQFLLAGLAGGEPVLYVTLSESAEELHAVAESHGWTLEGVTVRELTPSEQNLRAEEHYTMFHPSEVELGETTQTILADVERLAPARVVFDSLSELRLLAGNPLRYRRQILALKQYFSGRRCTVLFLDDMTSPSHDLQVQSVAHGVVRLEQLCPEFGGERRRLIVLKFRGSQFRGGYHDFVIRRGGLQVYPRLTVNVPGEPFPSEKLGSGIAELDTQLGGGLERGTSTLIIGAAGTGKSSLACQFAATAAARGQRAALFIFDESSHTLLLRSRALGMDLRPYIEERRIAIRQVNPAELSPGELMHSIRSAIDEDQVSLLVIDSLNGYLNAMPEERFLIIQLHELLTYAGQAGVATIIIGAHQGLFGPMLGPVEVSYLADAVIVMRYYEADGAICQAISVVKKRGGTHEHTIREFRLEDGRIVVGQPLRGFRGILTGTPIIPGEGRH